MSSRILDLDPNSMYLDQQNWCALQHKFPESPVLGYQATCWCTLSAAIFFRKFLLKKVCLKKFISSETIFNFFLSKIENIR